MTTMNIIDYCDEHEIKTLPIKLEVKDGKKRYLNKQDGQFEDGHYNFRMTDFKQYSLKQCKALTEFYLAETDWIALDTTTVHQVDVDDTAWWEDSDRKDEYNTWHDVPYYKSATKGCPHYFFYPMKEYCVKYGNRYYTKEIEYDHDILTGQWAYAHKDQVVSNSDTRISQMFLEPDRDKEKLIEAPLAATPAVPVECDITIDPFKRAILDNIDPVKYHNYPDWCKFIWAIKFTFGEQALEIAVAYSKPLDNFVSNEDVEKTMDSAIEARINWGYLMNLSKQSNKQKHYLIVSSKMDFVKNDDYNLAMVAIQLTDNNIIRDLKDQLYVYKKPYWIENKYSEVRVMVCAKLRDFYFEMLKHTAEEERQTEDEERQIVLKEKRKHLNDVINKINSNAASKQITEQFCINLPKSPIDFDTYKPYYFCFTNCAFDLRTNQKVTVEREDYITQTTLYEYRPSTPQELATIKDLFAKIFPKQDNLHCYVSVLRSGMIGLHFEKFVMANGLGSNGKGLLSSMLNKTMGDEYFEMSTVTVLTEKQKGGGAANQDIAKMNKKRAIVMTEPDDEATLRLGTLKGLTGDGKFSARALYQTECSVKLMLTMLLECNKKPKLNGRIDNALVRRFVNVDFESIFTNDAAKLQMKDCYYFPKNTMYKEDSWQNQHRFAFFDFLSSYDYIDIYEPKSIVDSTFKYLCEYDDFSYWLDKNYKLIDIDGKPDTHHRTKIKEMCYHYKERFLNQNSREFRLLTIEKFLEKLKENIKWQEIVRQRFKTRFQSKGIDDRKVFIGVECNYNSDSDSDNDSGDECDSD